MPLATRNANTMWIMHFLYHLAETGTAGFVMATGELSSGETARMEVRKALVENDYVDCIVQLSGQLFANTQIPCALWFLSKNRNGQGGFRKRTGEILFIDARKLGTLIPGSRKQKQLSAEEVGRISEAYQGYRQTGVLAEILGFSKVASLDGVREHNYSLAPGRYAGTKEAEEDDEGFEDKMQRLVGQLGKEMAESVHLDEEIRRNLAEIGFAAHLTEGV
jgi:type I restriction enzyme M protein